MGKSITYYQVTKKSTQANPIQSRTALVSPLVLSVPATSGSTSNFAQVKAHVCFVTVCRSWTTGFGVYSLKTTRGGGRMEERNRMQSTADTSRVGRNFYNDSLLLLKLVLVGCLVEFRAVVQFRVSTHDSSRLKKQKNRRNSQNAF